MKNRFKLAALALLALVGLASSAWALPGFEKHTTYYNNAAHQSIVGVRILYCDGSHEGWGVTSAYASTWTLKCY